MGQMRVSATDFRVHLKDWANQVASGGDVLVVERHGFAMGAFIGCAEFEEYLRWKRSQQGAKVVEAPPEHPENMPVEEVERVYAATAGCTDDFTLRWRSRAFLSLRARTGRYPDPPC